MWNNFKKWCAAVKRKIALVCKPSLRTKQRKWEEFTRDPVNAKRIAALPVEHGRKIAPAIWNPATKEWVWVTRQHRRKAGIRGSPR